MLEKPSRSSFTFTCAHLVADGSGGPGVLQEQLEGQQQLGHGCQAVTLGHRQHDHLGEVGVTTVNVNVNELRSGFSNTTRNPEGILSHNNRKS